MEISEKSGISCIWHCRHVNEYVYANVVLAHIQQTMSVKFYTCINTTHDSTHTNYLTFPYLNQFFRAQKIRTTTIKKSLFKTNLPKEYYVNKLTDKTLEVEELQKCIKSLQAQLAERCSAVNNNVNPEEILANYMAQADSWKEKIDKIYKDIRTAQENYYMMSSKEKLLKLRTKYKENTEQSRKLFSMDNECMKKVSKIRLHFGKYFYIIY